MIRLAAVATLALSCQAFTTPAFTTTTTSRSTTIPNKPVAPLAFAQSNNDDDEAERLRNMAAQLRAEAARLEADQQKQLAAAAQRAFDKFDTNQDGQVSLQELKSGLERAFKTELPEKRVKKLMEDFDKSGDGTLKLEEFVTVDQFRNRLDALARDEKAQALAMSKQAQKEDEAAKFLQAQLSLINDAPPTNGDKLLSILPYLFPLLDGLQFARFFVVENPENPLSIVIALSYALYRSIPFGGLISFFALSFLSGNPTINRLIRYNMQQAIFIDIALFFPGLLAAIYGLLAGNFQLPTSVTVLGTDALFFTLIATVGYCTISSLLGITPDKLPLISDAVNRRMPTVDMFDSQGNFLPKNRNEDKDKKD